MRTKAEVLADLQRRRDAAVDQDVRALLDEFIEKVNRDCAKIAPIPTKPVPMVSVIRLRRRLPEGW